MTLLSQLKSLWYSVMPKHNTDESTRELCEELRLLRLEFTRLCEDGCGLKHLRHSINELKESIMIAQTSFDTSLANLTAAVAAAAAALAASGPTTSTPDATVQAYIAGVDAQTVALATATPPPVTPAALKH